MAGKGKPLKGVGTAGPYSGEMEKTNCLLDVVSY